MKAQIISTQHSKELLAESARYALLRRLAPVLRHDMAGALQPLSMMSSLLETRLRHSSPDLATLARSSSQLNTLAREASNACLSLMTWLEPNISDLVTVAAGVEDVSALVTTELSFKGFTIVNKIGDVQAELPRSMTRNVFMAALIALTDAATAPANVVLEAQLMDSELVLTISIQSAQGELLPAAVPSYRNLEWEDVQALAGVESVRLTHTADSAKLHCPLTIAIVYGIKKSP